MILRPRLGRLPSADLLRCILTTAEGQIDFVAEGLLDGLQGEQRAERRRCFGTSPPTEYPQRSAAHHEFRHTDVPARRARDRRARPLYGARDREQRGTELDFLIAVRRAMGLPIPEPDEPVYTEGDLESVRMTQVVRAAGSPTRRSSICCARLGAASPRPRRRCGADMRLVLEPGVSEHELAQRYAYAASQLSPMLGPLVTTC